MKKNRIIILFLIISFASSFLLFNGCGKKEEDVIKIGAVLPLTGNLSSLGEKENRMLKFIEYYINKNKISSRLVIDVQDAKGDPKLATSIAQKFVADNVNYIIVSTTPLSAAALTVLEKNKKTTIIHSMTNSLLNNTELAVRIYPSIFDEIECINNFLKNKSLSRIFFLRVKGEFSELWVQNFRASNPEIIINDEEYSLTNLDLKNVVPKIKSFKPQYIIMLGYGSEYPQLLKQFKEFKITIPVISNIGFAYSGNRESAEKMKNLSLLENIVFPLMKIDKNDKLFMRLDSLYFDMYNKSIMEEPGALYYYDTIILLIKYLSEELQNQNSFRNYLANKIKKYNGLTGEIEFLANGDTKMKLMAAYLLNGTEIEFLK